MRRSLSLLLMLFLLLSQQATLSHAVSHWAPAAIAAASGEQALTDGEQAAGHACQLCVAAAQYAAVLPAACPHLPPAAAPAAHAVGALAHSFQAAPALAFQSRAPPPIL